MTGFIKTVGIRAVRGREFAWFNTGALCLSLLVAYYTRVFLFDVNLFHEWGQCGFSRDLLHIYQRSRSNLEYIYPPLGIYLCAALARLLDLLGIEWPSRAALLVYRIPPILGVYAGAFLARDIGDRLYSGGRGFLVGALYALSPPLLFASAVWGQWDSILVLAIVALVWAGVRRKDYLFGPIIGAALMFKPQISFVFPVIIVQGILALGGRKCLVNCLLAALVILILVSPFLLAGTGMELAHHYLRAPTILPVRSVSAYNAWQPEIAIELAISDPAGALPINVCYMAGCGLWALITLEALRRLARQRSWEACTEALVITLFGAFCVLTSMHERYVVPAAALSAILVARGIAGAGLYAALGATGLINIADVYQLTVFQGGVRGGPVLPVVVGIANTLILLAMLFLLRDARKKRPDAVVETDCLENRMRET